MIAADKKKAAACGLLAAALAGTALALSFKKMTAGDAAAEAAAPCSDAAPAAASKADIWAPPAVAAAPAPDCTKSAEPLHPDRLLGAPESTFEKKNPKDLF